MCVPPFRCPQRLSPQLEISHCKRGPVNLKTVYREVNRALDQRRLDAPDRYVRLQVERLTRAVQAIDCVIDDGDIEAVAQLLKVIDKLDRDHGLGFAPVSFASPPQPPPPPLALPRERTPNAA